MRPQKLIFGMFSVLTVVCSHWGVHVPVEHEGHPRSSRIFGRKQFVCASHSEAIVAAWMLTQRLKKSDHPERQMCQKEQEPHQESACILLWRTFIPGNIWKHWTTLTLKVTKMKIVKSKWEKYTRSCIFSNQLDNTLKFTKYATLLTRQSHWKHLVAWDFGTVKQIEKCFVHHSSFVILALDSWRKKKSRNGDNFGCTWEVRTCVLRQIFQWSLTHCPGFPL